MLGARTQRPIRWAGPTRRWDCSRSSAGRDPTSSPYRMSPLYRRATSRTRFGGRRPRLGLRPADPSGPGARHHGLRRFPAGTVWERFSRCPWCGWPVTRSPMPSSVIFLSATRADYDAAGTGASYADDRIAGERYCASLQQHHRRHSRFFGDGRAAAHARNQAGTAHRRDPAGRGAWARSNRQHPHVRAAT